MKILLAGVIDKPSQSGTWRVNAFRQNGHEVVGVSTTDLLLETRTHEFSKRFMPQKVYEMLLAGRAKALSDIVLKAAIDAKPDIIWLEWPRLITADTVLELRRRFPKAIIASYQDDNPFGNRKFASYGWQRFFDAMRHYDIHFVKRPSDVHEYQSRGAGRVEVVQAGYAEDLFFPEPYPAGTDTPEVVFIGTALDYRIGFLDELTGRLGLNVHIYGVRWERTPLYANRRHLLHGKVDDDGHRRILSSAKIALGFVSHSNLDDYTTRIFQIPACGTMFLGEGTESQKQIYVEDKEAVFFTTAEECRDKIHYYLSHDEEREAIAAAGLRKTDTMGYRVRMKEAMDLMLSCRKLADPVI